MRDMFGLTLLSLGVEPENATIDGRHRAPSRSCSTANDAGQFRGYYDNAYYDALAAGDLAICVAWSGDISQMQLTTTRRSSSSSPTDGGMRWNDNLAIPKGSTEQIDETRTSC